ncbi:MAG: glycosyltransferase [Kiritimatiellae bacterium]|jgi:glycosyltransferase involved in cell wall biosynthesis|nr:glycosyltransferase [Kiritimatiellia bacterium]
MYNFPEEWKNINAGLCHDWLTGMRGGERVLELLCKGFPDATISTLIANRESVSDIINQHEIVTSAMQKIPNISQHYRRFLPLLPFAMKTIPKPDCDLLITMNHCVAKAIPLHKETKHICYCFTPMRYAWTFYEEYFGTNPVKAAFVKPLLAALRQWDKKTALNVTQFVAISEHIQKRIKKFYDLDSEIVYPHVAIDQWTLSSKKPSQEFDLIVSAIVPYKKIDLAVEAYNKSGFPLRVIGTGSGLERLKAIAKPNVTFLERQSDESILEHYQNCRMLIFPGEEDFGIVPLEAQACGRPVVAFDKGGATETIVRDKSGIFFKEQTVESLNEAVEKCVATDWNSEEIRANAEKFGPDNFITGMDRVIKKVLR